MTGTFLVESAMLHHVPWKSFNCLLYSIASGRESAISARQDENAYNSAVRHGKNRRIGCIEIYWSTKTHDEHWWTSMNQDKDMLLEYWQRAKASGMLEEDEKAFPSGQMLNVMVYWLLFFHWYGLIWYLVITVTIDSVILNFVAMLVMISLMPWATRKHRQRVCTHRINCHGTGMKALGDYLHGMGFKYGIYTDRGTCLRLKLSMSLTHPGVKVRIVALARPQDLC